MVFDRLLSISLEQIHADDDTFKISIEYLPDHLVHSIANLGILHPLWVQEITPSKFRIVNGFKRFKIAQLLNIAQLPALIISKAFNDFDNFNIRIREKCISGQLNPIEISYILSKLQEKFKMSPSDIMRTYFAAMGLGENIKIFETYDRLHRLEIEIQRAIIIGDLSVEIAALLGDTEVHERLSYFAIINKLKLSKSNQREFFHLLQDIKRIKKTSLENIINDQAVQSIINNERLTPTQKTEKIKTILFSWRYPRFAALKKQFESQLREMKLPPTVRLSPSPFFADSEYHIDLSFRTVAEFHNHLKILQQLEENGFILKLEKLM